MTFDAFFVVVENIGFEQFLYNKVNVKMLEALCCNPREHGENYPSVAVVRSLQSLVVEGITSMKLLVVVRFFFFFFTFLFVVN